MTKLEYRALKYMLMVGLMGAAACGGSDSSSDSGTSEDAGHEADSGSSSDAGGAMDAESEDAESEDASKSDAGSAPTCSAYCTAIMANCTAGKAQYPSAAVCMSVCASFPVGAASDTSGNTLGCRLYHAGAAAADATTHCNHAGLTGGDKDPTDTSAGVCGEGCDAFCNEALRACTAATSPGGTAPYASKDACMTECKTFPASSNTFSTADTSGDSFNCRAYHLTAASTTPDPHCGHIKKASPTCK